MSLFAKFCKNSTLVMSSKPPNHFKSQKSKNVYLSKTISIKNQCSESNHAGFTSKQYGYIGGVHISMIVWPVTYVWPVRQVPVVSHPPVILIALIPIPGFFGSPHNLNDKLFDKTSHLGSFSQVSSTDWKLCDGVFGGHPQTSHPQSTHDVQQGSPGLQGVTDG